MVLVDLGLRRPVSIVLDALGTVGQVGIHLQSERSQRRHRVESVGGEGHVVRYGECEPPEGLARGKAFLTHHLQIVIPRRTDAFRGDGVVVEGYLLA